MSNLKISTWMLTLISIPSVLLAAIQIAEIDANFDKAWVAYAAAALTPLGWAVWSRVV